MWKRRRTAVLVVLLSLHSVSCSQQRFPEWKVLPLGLLGSWDRASSVVVADLQNVEYVGSQKITNPPWPVQPAMVRIYWCQGDFNVYSAVKGKVPRNGKKFLWGGGKPGCHLTEHAKGATEGRGPMTRVWFVREEGNYIRPVVDALGVYFVAFNVKWDDGSREDSKKKFGRLLLSPNAVDTSPRDYGRWWDFELPSTACSILGRDECIGRIKGLAALGDPLLRRNACDFLKSQFRETCTP